MAEPPSAVDSNKVDKVDAINRAGPPAKRSNCNERTCARVAHSKLDGFDADAGSLHREVKARMGRCRKDYLPPRACCHPVIALDGTRMLEFWAIGVP
jgi:hypothetical protein